MDKISAWIFLVCAVIFLILFIGQKKKIKQKNYEIEQLKEKNKKDAENFWKDLDVAEQKVYEDNHKKRNEQLQQLNEIIAKQETFQANRKSSIEEEIQELRLQKLQQLQNQLIIDKAQIDQDKRDYKLELEKVKCELSQFQAKRQAVNEAIRREREVEEKEDFYRICLLPEEIEDIEVLKNLAPRFRHREIVPKLMWDTMVLRATKEMIKRVTGGRAIGGIYKITYIPTGEAYIGKTTDFGTRWQSHVQTALGMEKVARSTLHVHMASHGIQNYTFEILEEVAREKQTEREKFYIELYGTQRQLNMRIG